MDPTSAALGAIGGLLIGWGVGRVRHAHPDGWGFMLLGLVPLVPPSTPP